LDVHVNLILHLGAKMEPESLHLIFERSPEEARLTGVIETIQALGQNGMDVKVVARNPGVEGLVGRMLRFWFPYLWSAGITGVVPGAAEAGEYVVTLDPHGGSAFGAVLGAWLQALHGRKVRAKYDEIEIEAQASEEAETLLARLESLRQRRAAALARTP
jgi:hypothetical protein